MFSDKQRASEYVMYIYRLLKARGPGSEETALSDFLMGKHISTETNSELDRMGSKYMIT
jgi:hypothetical protein